MTRSHRLVRVIATLAALATLAATPGCGGGGAGGEPPPPPPPPAPGPAVGVAPSIQAGPQSTSITVGQSASFSVVATGDAPLSYQWQLGGADIAGATAASYSVTPTAATTTPAEYRVRVSNAAGSVLSAAATLTVAAAPTGTAAPQRLSAGFGYTLAVRGDGSVLAWGQQMKGGTGTAVAGTSAVRINGVSNAVAVVADGNNLFNSSLALRGDGQVWHWGYPASLLSLVSDAAVAPGLAPAVAVARCTSAPPVFEFVLRGDGTVWLSGTQPVPGLANVVAMTDRSEDIRAAVCAPLVVKQDGSVWRLALAYGVVDAQRVQLSQVGGLPPVVAVSCGGWNLGQRSCLALTAAGTVWAWGDNSLGQLGDGTTTARTIPVQVAGLAGVRRIAMGDAGAAAWTADKRLYTWGAANGRPDTEDRTVPGPLAGWTDVEDFALGPAHGVVRRSDGSVWGWGSNSYGELGDGTSGNDRPQPVRALGINLN